MNIDNLSKSELFELRKKINDKLNAIEKIDSFNYLKQHPDITKYSYILFKEFDDSDPYKVGFNRHNESGFIDDNVPEEEYEIYNAITDLLSAYESNTCTVEFVCIDEEVLKQIKVLRDLGIKPMKPGWL